MSILKIARMGHPVLRTKARALDRTEVRGATIQRLIDDMIETMHEYHGVGLAAPQIHESLRLFVASLDHGTRDADDAGDAGDAGLDDDSDESAEAEPIAIVNPEITVVGSDVVEDWEGCLSIPDIRGRVPRAREIRVRGLDRNGDRLVLRARGFAARVIQHETDHLDGVLFFDRMKAFDSLTFLDEYSRYWVKD
jgi:peptide deformylase